MLRWLKTRLSVVFLGAVLAAAALVVGGTPTHSRLSNRTLAYKVGCPTGATSVPDRFAADICQIVQDEGFEVRSEQSLLRLIGHFPALFKTSPGNWSAAPTATLTPQDFATFDADKDLMQAAIISALASIADLEQDALQDLTFKNAPCIGKFVITLGRAGLHDLAIADAYTHARQTIDDIRQGNLDGSAAYDVVGYADIAATNLYAKLQNLLDFFNQFSPRGPCSGSVSRVVNAILASVPVLQGNLATLSSAMSTVAAIPTHGYDLLGSTTGTGVIGPITIVVNPNETPGGVPSVPATNIISIPSPPAANVSPPSCPSFSCQLSGGFGSSWSNQTGAVWVASQVTKVGSFTTDASGAFSTAIPIPGQVAVGAHELYAVVGGPNGVSVLGSKINVTRTGSSPQPLCIGTLNGVTINGSLAVRPGMVCTLTNSRVNGTVTVEKGAVFEADSSRLDGGVVANAPESFALCGDRVNGTVAGADSSTLPPLIGDANSAPSCEPTKITGS